MNTPKISQESFPISVESDVTLPLCSDAGLIVLWPYLEALFSEFNLLSSDKKKMKSGRATEKAARLLAYILGFEHADSITHEQYLTIHMLTGQADKLLPGPSSDYIQYSDQNGVHKTDVDLASPECFEKERCEILLREIIFRWKSLKNLPNIGLQKFFLQRKGTWSRVANDFYLTIFPADQDVHLSRLPWNVENLSLPWCSYRIFVRWS